MKFKAKCCEHCRPRNVDHFWFCSPQCSTFAGITLSVRTVAACAALYKGDPLKKKANENEKSVRKDMRVDKELLAQIEAVRGDVPFAAWVKRAIKMRLERESNDSTITVVSAHVGDRVVPATVRTKLVSSGVELSANAKRAAETKALLFSSINALSGVEKSEILNARYPKSAFRKAIAEVVSKDSIAKYWDEVQAALSN